VGSGRLSEAERAAAFAKPPPAVPRTTVFWILVACVALGLGGLVVDHFFGGASKVGLTSLPPSSRPAALPSQTTLPSIHSSLSSMMDLQPLSAAAPPVALATPAGRAVTLAEFRGKVVVLSFFDSRCDDICPVLAAELRRAMSEVASAGKAGKVEVLTVNTDPLATSPADAGPAERAMAGVGRWLFLTGALRRLDAVWSAYGVAVDAQPSTGLVSHSEALYFLGPTGRLAGRATPFADELNGSYHLSAPILYRFGTGIATEVLRLLGRR